VQNATYSVPFDTQQFAFWLTDAKQNIKFKPQTQGLVQGRLMNAVDIVVNPTVMMQEMDGFGFTLNGGSALHLHNMSVAKRKQLLTELFDYQQNSIGVSYLRLSIGASDLDEKVFSYNELATGKTDVAMQNFTLEQDRKYLIPMLHEILKINPEIKIIASPWSPPLWMKSNNRSVGGRLKAEYFDAYAAYFVNYIQEMAKEGITIDAITVQNEPLHAGNNPSLLMTAAEQAKFIKGSLGPAFQVAKLSTKIIIYDHNADRPDYPIDVLNDPAAKQYIDGSAFHLYAGDISALSEVRNAYPDKNIYFTEQWVSASGDFWGDFKWHMRELLIGAPRNWSKTVLEWNLAADEKQQPYTPGGCVKCLGALTITGDEVKRNQAYYIIAHAAKFVRPGSRRIESSTTDSFPNVAFKTQDGHIVIIVLNNSHRTGSFNIVVGDKSIHSTLSSGSAGTYVWKAD
jgi:glucosylceramidase